MKRKLPKDNKDSYVVIVLMPADSGAAIVAEPISRAMEKRVLRRMRDILPKEPS